MPEAGREWMAGVDLDRLSQHVDYYCLPAYESTREDVLNAYRLIDGLDLGVPIHVGLLPGHPAIQDSETLSRIVEGLRDEGVPAFLSTIMGFFPISRSSGSNRQFSEEGGKFFYWGHAQRDMEITGVTATTVDVPLVKLDETLGIGPYVTNHGQVDSMERVLVEVETDEEYPAGARCGRSSLQLRPSPSLRTGSGH